MTVRLRESFSVRVRAASAREAEQRVWAMNYEEGDATSHGDRKWTSVKARRSD